MPYAWLSASGEVAGQSRSVDRSGLSDVTLRLSVNLYGAPALSLQEFRDYRQDTIVGVSLLVTAPTGQYDPQRLINIGTNRWSFKPEVGISKALGRWTLEAAAGATFFTDNDEFLAPTSASRSRCTVCKDTRSTISAPSFGARSTRPITPAAAPR